MNDVFKVIKQDMRTGGITTFHFKDVDGGTEVRIEHQDGRIEFEFHPTPKHHSELVAELLEQNKGSDKAYKELFNHLGCIMFLFCLAYENLLEGRQETAEYLGSLPGRCLIKETDSKELREIIIDLQKCIFEKATKTNFIIIIYSKNM